ncbi:MAG TPA: VC0807 family protein [Stellaceae bacterium]|nr:VC0807 family protein [Stellaceae bacterium]
MTQSAGSQPGGLSAFAPLFIDILAPLAAYAVLSRLGANEFISLGAAATLPAIYIAAAVLRGKRIDRVAVLVLALLALAIALTIVTGDPRILLAKSVIVTGFAGLYFLATLLAERPFIFYASQQTVGRDEPGGEPVWDERWQASQSFRRAMRAMTVIWGLGLVGEAIVRAAIIYTLPVAQAVVWGQLWAIGCLVVLCLVSIRIGRRTRDVVRAEMRRQA